MKKLAIILAVSMVMAAGTTAFAENAANYDDTNNKVSVGNDISTFSTVIISRGADESFYDPENVVYADQENSAFSASMNFFLKADAASGEYSVLLGNESGDTESMTFTIGGEITPGDEKMTYLSYEPALAEGKYNVAFVLEAADMSKYNAIKIVIDEGDGEQVGGFRIADVFDTTIQGTANLGLQINNIPAVYFNPDTNVNRIKVYLSNGTTDGTIKDWE